MVQNQYVLFSFIEQSIKPEFDIQANDLIRAWHPRLETRAVLIDPQRSFGRPIVEPGVPTRTLADALRAEGGDAAAVAGLFDTTEDRVRQAIAFETTLAA